AEETRANLFVERDADAHTLGGAEEGILLRDEFAADLCEVCGNDLARIGRAERDTLLPLAAILEDRHEERLAGKQPFTRAHERAHEAALLLRAIAEDGFHLDAVVHVYHSAGFGHGGFHG